MPFSSQSGRLAADVSGATDVSGAAGSHRIVLVHGFTQTGRCLGPMADDLARDHEVVLPDAPGHGGSVDHAGAGLWRGADLLAATGGRATYVGYSMGARLCLHLALAHPDLVERLVLIGATAGISDDEERAVRRRRDHDLADRIEKVGVSVFLAEWLAQPMFAALPPEAVFDEERHRNTAAGLAASLRNAGTGSMDPLWTRLGEITAPVLAVAGSDDGAFVERSRAVAAAVSGSARTVDGAGHAAHLEAPTATIALIRAFLGASPPHDA